MRISGAASVLSSTIAHKIASGPRCPKVNREAAPIRVRQDSPVGFAAGASGVKLTAIRTATNVKVLRMNRGVAPYQPKNTPARAGPITRERLNCTPLAVMARVSSARGTSRGVSTCHAGTLKAITVPFRAARSSSQCTRTVSVRGKVETIATAAATSMSKN